MHHKLLTLDASGVKFYDDQKGVFSGYASVFGGVDAYGDTIYPGAYATTLKNRQRPVQMRWNHFGPVIGKWTRLEEDEKGLLVEGELTPGHTEAMNVYASLKHGAISGLSIGYRPAKATENERGGLDLHEIDLIEISVVESPADLAAQIGDIKCAVENAGTMKELEALLRDVGGFSKAAAKAFMARTASLRDMPRDVADDEQAIVAAMLLKTLNIKGVHHERPDP